MTQRVGSYDPDAKVPTPGSRWVWEIDNDDARELVEVIEVIWNGEEWWIRTRSLAHRSMLPLTARPSGGVHLNDLGRFVEAVTAVDVPKHRWEQRIVEQGVERRWGDQTPVAS